MDKDQLGFSHPYPPHEYLLKARYERSRVFYEVVASVSRWLRRRI
ncbi:hypothetical protein PsAD2_04157 [Pseudovibrio axinellae]|uniref:Uncharacterized protein n=1 Tax=Pseudovibrio axinellae TaxID=989403 RepID=A0A161XCC6_9HYPH|nr:hypothetical protein [Pseudovibrio axinellae]KZL08488.1 hypothetical protein PsAD2_04157 [Pseudovibrio axinellae]SEP75865.1 hypothetical protein SAMN05421798_101323 [Pseudovibrio axinellae]